MASRSRPRNLIVDTQRHIRKARELAQRYDVDKAYPGNFLDQDPEERAYWDDLLKKMN